MVFDINECYQKYRRSCRRQSIKLAVYLTAFTLGPLGSGVKMAWKMCAKSKVFDSINQSLIPVRTSEGPLFSTRLLDSLGRSSPPSKSIFAKIRNDWIGHISVSSYILPLWKLTLLSLTDLLHRLIWDCGSYQGLSISSRDILCHNVDI